MTVSNDELGSLADDQRLRTILADICAQTQMGFSAIARVTEWVNIQVARSNDLINWVYMGDALPEKPEWAETTQDFWAPSVIYDGSTYYMYYSATPDVCHLQRQVGLDGSTLPYTAPNRPSPAPHETCAPNACSAAAHST